MLGPIGILLALALSQQPPIKCTVVGFTAITVRMVCGEREGEISTGDWPTEQWGRAMIGDAYPMSADGFPIALTAEERQAQRDTDERVRQKTLAEQRRWRIRPTQKSGP